MNQPAAQPVDPEDVRNLALAVLREDRFPLLATIDEQTPRLRPVSPVQTTEFTVWVANLKSYHKTVEIQANPNVELCYVSPAHDQVRITGTARVETDQHMLQDIWDHNPLLQHYLGSLDNPELIIYRIEPSQIRFMREWALAYHDVEFESPDGEAM